MNEINSFKILNKFPSPYGVSFILILANSDFISDKYEFPSPYGVSFILIFKIKMSFNSRKDVLKFPSPYGVSFILINFIIFHIKSSL